MGVQTVKLTEARGQLAGAKVVRDGDQLMMISNGGTVIKMAVTDVKRLGRSTQGVIVMRLRDVETVGSIALVMDAGDDPPAPISGERIAGSTEADGSELELFDDPIEDDVLEEDDVDDDDASDDDDE